MPTKTSKEKDTLTPLMQQYRAIKQNYPGAILFFRLGDFYEMFGEDALKASPILEIVLTKRQDIPMCGIPFHSAASYIAKLIKKGISVAICEQTEDPGQTKGIVKREVIRVITPGTVLEDNLLEQNRNNYLLAVFSENGATGIAYVDVSTGDFFVSEEKSDFNSELIQSELAKINPGEFLLAKNAAAPSGKPARALDDWYFNSAEAEERILKVFRLNSLKSFGLEKYPAALCACGALMKYVEETQKENLRLIRPPRIYSISEHLLLDENAVSSLEVPELINTVDRTVTPMGSRLLRGRLLNPLTNPEKINARLGAVEFFFDDGIARRNALENLKNTCDIERILSRLSSGIALPRELIALKQTLERIPALKPAFGSTPETLPGLLRTVYNALVYLEDTVELISVSISETPGADIRKGGVIKKGYNKGLDELREIASGGKTYIAGIEQRERERTGINSLKIGYTSAFGYYIEVTKANLDKVPADFIRRQTLVNNERFVTEELKEYESKVLSAEEKSLRLEKEIFEEIRNAVISKKEILQALAKALARADLYASLAAAAKENNYAKPVIYDGYDINITDGRHPVVEAALRGKAFVPNDILLDGKENQIMVLTGPNMAGKSTYLRQNALIIIMGQAGMYVPAAEARIGIIDRIFTRIGAADNLAGGDSTFMVEMRETAKILHNATARSLLILDEVGRGTSTFDGISIAWAVIEYLSAARPGAEFLPKVLFATHYFELTGLAGRIRGIKNFNVSVREWQGQVTFLHKIAAGSSDRSYGIHVAKLAGLPSAVIERAFGILSGLEKKEIETGTEAGLSNEAGKQLELPSEIIEEFDRIDPDNMTPMEALLALHQLKERYKKK